MVQAAITARNPGDGTARVWGLSVDKIPSGNWLKDPTIVKSSKKTGELWNLNLQIPDGMHKLYFIVSLTPNTNGTYAGEAIFDQAGFNFQGVDNDSLVSFDVNVKGGKATRATGVPATTKASDVPTSPGFIAPIKSRIMNLGDKLKTSKYATWRNAGIATAVVIVAPIAFFYYRKMMRKGRRRL